MYEGISGVRERRGQAASRGSGRRRKVVIRRTEKRMKREARCGRVIRSPSTSNAANGEHSLPCGDTTEGLDLALADISVAVLENMVPNATLTTYLQSPYDAGYQDKDSHS
jgi:hypothetical protein